MASRKKSRKYAAHTTTCRMSNEFCHRCGSLDIEFDNSTWDIVDAKLPNDAPEFGRKLTKELELGWLPTARMHCFSCYSHVES